jgi:hypothetical protein
VTHTSGWRRCCLLGFGTLQVVLVGPNFQQVEYEGGNRPPPPPPWSVGFKMGYRYSIALVAAFATAMLAADPQNAPTEANAPYFTYYSANLSATPWLTLYQADSLADAAAAWSTFSVPSILLLYDALFTRVPGRMILRPDYASQLQALMAAAAPLRASGAVLGLNLGDELVWNCLSQANLTVAAEAVRALCPRGEKGCVFWYNEAAVFRAGPFKDSCGNENEAFRVPAALDWFSVDIYHMDGIVPGWVNDHVTGFYNVRIALWRCPPAPPHTRPPSYPLSLVPPQEFIFPLLTANQKAVLVPGSYGSDVNHYPNGTYVCNRACYDEMIAHDAKDYHTWATTDNRIAGVFPWNWNGAFVARTYPTGTPNPT